MASNNSNKAKSIMYSYKLSDLKKLYRKEYGKTGHGNAMTYNSKANQVLVVGPDEYKKIFVYNEKDLKKKKEITSHHHCSSIGYDASNDLYVQHAGKRIFMTDTSDDLKKLHDFDIHPFETTQDLEYHNGYTFFCTTDAGAKSTYQNYAFFSEGDNIIYVYNTQLDKEKKPNKNFGRLVARLHITGLGELESVSFHDGNMYFGFAPHSHDSHSYVFYKVNYKEFAKEVKKIK